MTTRKDHERAHRLAKNKPELAVVVLALGAPPEVVDAVKSLMIQDPPAEIVVVNSGGGGMAELLAQNGIDVKVIEKKRRLFVGAARNLGIMATRAPYVAFLASDCLATPGWTRHRLASHRKGKVAVASALLNGNPRNIVAWASYLATHHRRLPGTPKKKTSQYGASYARSLFDQYGLFREDLRVSEDTEFHRRLPPGTRPAWRPKVRTINRYPTGLLALLSDQYRRGRRAAKGRQEVYGNPLPGGGAAWWKRMTRAIAISRTAVKGKDRIFAWLAWPLLPVAIGAFYLGVAAWAREQVRPKSQATEARS